MDVEVTLYKVCVVNDVGDEIDLEEIHHFIMNSMIEGRIDLETANILLHQCRFKGQVELLT